MKTDQNELIYIPFNEHFSPSSLSIYDSDHLNNTLVMQQLIGTLVINDNSGTITPYIAENWQVSADGKKWDFKFKKGLLDQNGTEITPTTFLDCFLPILKSYISKFDPPVFKELNGFREFKSGYELKEGIIAHENVLTFNFRKKISGLLEFLTMPYFGYVSKDNFQNCEWQDNQKIISSGPYLVKKFSKEIVILEKRNDWKLNTTETPDLLYFSNDIKKVRNYDKMLKIQQIDNKEHDTIDGLDITSIPTNLFGIILSTENKILKNENVRNYLRNKIMYLSRTKKIDSKIVFRSFGFYHHNIDSHQKINQLEVPEQLKQKLNLKVSIPDAKGKYEVEYLKDILIQATKETKIELEWNYINKKTDSNWREETINPKKYDIRIGAVNAGSSPINWVVEMIFCSNLGVCFPDPFGKICNLTKRYSEKNITPDTYLSLLEQYIFEDAYIIPIIHTATRWKFSKNIDYSTIDSTTPLIRFDLIRRKV